MTAKTAFFGFHHCLMRQHSFGYLAWNAMVAGNSVPRSFYCTNPSNYLSAASLVKLEEMKSEIARKLKEEFDEKKQNFDPFKRDFEDLSVDKYADLIKSEDDRHRIESILKLYEYKKYVSALVPKTLTLEQMKRLMNEGEGNEEKRFYYFYCVELEKMKQKHSREFKKAKAMAFVKLREISGNKAINGIYYDKETNAPLYGDFLNSLFLKSTRHFSKHDYKTRLYDACLFGQPLVFDFSFEKEMDDNCLNCTINQMTLCVSDNRIRDQPFSLWFCNLKRESKTDERIKKAIGNLYSNSGSVSFINVKEETYLDLFPKEKLVYLTPNADETLYRFDHEAVYIVGAFVDRSKETEIASSYWKAKREGLKMAKLPIDYYAHMQDIKKLTVDQIMKVLVTVKNTNSWIEAFKHIPQCKQKTPEEVASEERRRIRRLEFTRKSLFSEDL